MRSRSLLGEVHPEWTPPARPDTYQRVRQALDEALAELQLPLLDKDDTGSILKLPATTTN